jgi:hypothetical protein
LSLEPVTALSILRTLHARSGYPRKAEGEADMANALMECCVNEAHARAVVAEFRGNFPTRDELSNQAANLSDKFKEKKAVCEQCQGSGWVIRKKTVNGQEIEGAARCVCRQPSQQPAAKPASPPIEFNRSGRMRSSRDILKDSEIPSLLDEKTGS